MISKPVLAFSLLLLSIVLGVNESALAQRASSTGTTCQEIKQETLIGLMKAYSSLRASGKILIAGEVERPILLDSNPDFSLLEGLAMAGGLKRSAGQSLCVFRQNDAGQILFKFGATTTDYYQGRTVVPRLEKADIVFVPGNSKYSRGSTWQLVDSPIRIPRLLFVTELLASQKHQPFFSL